jgi:hypothetical protein
MKKIILFVLFTVLVSYAQTANPDTTKPSQPTSPPEVQQSQPSKWYYGGTVGFNFWGDYFYLSVNPLVGYQVSPKFSVGGKVQYAYINDQRYAGLELTSHNYGAGIFTRYRPIYQIYLHAEFDYASYEDYTIYDPLVGDPYAKSERNWVPFLLLGGGLVQRVGPNAAVYVEVLFDVLQNENSPYGWDPIISVGGGVGF